MLVICYNWSLLKVIAPRHLNVKITIQKLKREPWRRVTIIVWKCALKNEIVWKSSQPFFPSYEYSDLILMVSSKLNTPNKSELGRSKSANCLSTGAPTLIHSAYLEYETWMFFTKPFFSKLLVMWIQLFWCNSPHLSIVFTGGCTKDADLKMNYPEHNS